MKVYVLTVGEYSDVYVYGVFSSEEIAKRYANALDGFCEEFELDGQFIEPINRGYLYWHVAILASGNIDVRVGDNISNNPKNKLWIKGKKPSGMGEWMIFDLWAKDKQHAVKIANDIRARCIAEGLTDTGQNIEYEWGFNGDK